MMKITFVKKILSDGSACRKCAEVEQKLLESGRVAHISERVIADERDANSPGMLLARKHQIERAPFFLVERPSQPVEVYTIYLQFAKEVLRGQVDEKDELKEVMQNNADLDFI